MHDEIDLAAGKIKVKTGGGDAGHNGLALHHRDARSGLSPRAHRRRPSGREIARSQGHVLQNFSKVDEEWLVPLLSAMAEAAPLLARDDDAGFMNKVALMLNPPEKKPKPERKDE